MLNLCEKESTKINVLLTVFQVEACLFDLGVITHKENTKENLASNIYCVWLSAIQDRRKGLF